MNITKAIMLATILGSGIVATTSYAADKESHADKAERQCIERTYHSELNRGESHREALGNAKEVCREARNRSEQK